jgi:hypothetical protein
MAPGPLKPLMTLTRAPVKAESSVTELPASFATQRSSPFDVIAAGLSNPYLEPLMTLTRAPVEAESSVTELPSKFATQTRVPLDVMAWGLSKPHPRTLTPESGLTRLAHGETREA